jgi:hypothetical protein
VNIRTKKDVNYASLFNDNRPTGVFKYLNILAISAHNLDKVGGMFSNFKREAYGR